MTILIAAPTSGAGKTTITLALLAGLVARGLRVQSFKVGPDYIDPMFHARITGRDCINLDVFLTDEQYVRETFGHHCQDRQVAVIEGVMGLFDGRVGAKDFASSAHVARLLEVPVVLVVDAARVGYTVAATLYGLCQFDPRLRVAGVIFNRVGSERHATILREAAATVGLPVLGIVRRSDALALPSRHLGLVPVGELDRFAALQHQLIALAADSFDWQALLPLLQVTGLQTARPAPEPVGAVRVGIAHDQAFNFYYPDNLALLQALGAELVPFSPLANTWPACDGYLLGGGFPEEFAPALAEAHHFFAGLRAAHQQRRPIYAECGGLMILARQLAALDAQVLPMAGIIAADCWMDRRTVIGYHAATALRSSCVVAAGDHLRGHLFHRSRLAPAPSAPLVRLDSGETDGWGGQHLHASYLHLHWGRQQTIARRFLGHCLAAKLSAQA